MLPLPSAGETDLLSLAQSSQLLQCSAPLLLVVLLGLQSRGELALQVALWGGGGRGKNDILALESAYFLQLDEAQLCLQARLGLGRCVLAIALKLCLP